MQEKSRAATTLLLSTGQKGVARGGRRAVGGEGAWARGGGWASAPTLPRSTRSADPASGRLSSSMHSMFAFASVQKIPQSSPETLVLQKLVEQGNEIG